MKARDKDKVMALRLLHADIKNRAINERRDSTDDDTLAVIARLIKQRQESIEQFTKGGREDLCVSRYARSYPQVFHDLR